MANASPHWTKLSTIQQGSCSRSSLLPSSKSRQTIKRKLKHKPDCYDVVHKSLLLFFSDPSDDPVKGWDRRAIPKSYLDMMEKYVFKRWDRLPVKASKSPVATRLNKDRPWKAILADHLRNTREKFFMTLAYPFQYLDPMLNHRHTIKKNMYLMNHVSLVYSLIVSLT